MSGSSPGPRQYRALAQIAARRRRAGYRAAKSQDQVTAIGEYRAALGLIQQCRQRLYGWPLLWG